MKKSEMLQKLNLIFEKCDDYVERETKCGAHVFYLRFACDKKYLSEKILKVLNASQEADAISLTAAEIKKCEDSETAADEMLAGSCVVCFSNGECVSCGAEKQAGRSVGEPNTESTVYGSHAGFVESIDTNVSIIRRCVRSKELAIENYTLGTVSKTPVTLVYLQDRAKKEAVQEIRSKLISSSLPYILDSGYISMLLEEGSYGFATTGKSEKVSRVCAKILSGRIAIAVEGDPFIITAPFVFAETLQETEDYRKNAFCSTFVRMLRFFALLISLYLPAFFVAASYSPIRLIPLELMMAMTENQGTVAFGVFGELATALIIFEIIREVGLRMPRAVGDSVGILASIILGDAAVRAGLASSVVIMAAALSAVANFAVPAYKDSSVLLRLLLMCAARALSFGGIGITTLGLIAVLVNTKSFGTPYMTPVTPFDKNGILDFLISMPEKNIMRGDAGITNE
ncbi:MAG TPA: spore germination protein [Bacillota bacterium]|nr:spore germination protein [Bacillota bacterium]